MARQLRLEFPGAIWHVTSRGNEKRDIIRDEKDCRKFEALLAPAVISHGWLLHAWVLMRNHYHLLIETPTPTLSRGIKLLNQRYAQYINKRHERVGHLFQGRFKSILVEREGHLLELLRYIVLNPVRCGAVRYASDYEWSSYRATAGLVSAPSWLKIDWTLSQFGPGRPAAQDEYRRFVADARGASYNPWDSLVGQIYLGGEGFRERMQKRVEEQKRSAEHPVPQRRLVPEPNFEKWPGAVADSFALTPADLTIRTNRNARKALAFLATEEGCTLRSVGDFLGLTPPAVSKMRNGGRQLYDCDRRFREKVEMARNGK